MPTLVDFNSLQADAAVAILLRCCAATRWAETMVARRPFQSEAALFEAADMVWEGLGEAGWHEAFAGHSRIGDLESLRAKYAATRAWSEGEQAGVGAASEEVLRALAAGNRVYEERFGFIFIVCATGKQAPEMLALLQARLDNDSAIEIRIAAAEQQKITRIRLEKWLAAEEG